MRVMSDLNDGNTRIDFEKCDAIIVNSSEQITILHQGKIVKTLSFNELVNTLK